MELSDEEIVAMAASATALATVFYYQKCKHELTEESSPSSVEDVDYVDEILDGPTSLCREHFCMDKRVFRKLCDVLQSKRLLRNTNRVRIEEQVAIFLLTIGRNESNRILQDRFHHSGETISRHFGNVLNAIASLARDYFKPSQSETPKEILDNPLFYPYFQDCVGAIGGIHVPAMINVEEQSVFRNEKGFTSQNVMAACSFDLSFQYVLAGWQGSATDMSVLSSALTREDRLQIPPGKYFLVGFGYENMPGFLAPYMGFRYHPAEFLDTCPPENAQELFNYRHFLLKCAVDRSFGALKARFSILRRPPPYPFEKQVKLVVAACVIHNHIRRVKKNDWLFKEYEDLIPLPDDLSALFVPQLPQTDLEAEQQAFASFLRDSIAQAMWDDYMQSSQLFDVANYDATDGR